MSVRVRRSLRESLNVEKTAFEDEMKTKWRLSEDWVELKYPKIWWFKTLFETKSKKLNK